ncbi:hypothetical protein SAMN05660841_02793 [Sphingobacterium nematocida]|uniref:Uncharacterized protein n=1 Tax=Sphingobacterium nematocida TaxID=1513896 RepID=A0A1T5EU23_9SPHI|nr:hypothetical protein [Sphingobacterium nematocida]SKB87289.1 hypothetical protein SAMN05660841_02793 [Sphingobacterium nematocida]
MSLHKDPELKSAVLNLSQKEKDKLLVRLIGKDKMLLKQLHYQLLENEYDLENRIEVLKRKLEKLFLDTNSKLSNEGIFSNYKTLNTILRQASGTINEHEKVTKDKFSAVESRLYILTEPYRLYPKLYEKSHLQAAEKLQKYIITRIKVTLNNVSGLHEDLQFDLQEAVNTVEQIKLSLERRENETF